MFEIEYKGANCVTISTKKSKLVTDPKLSLVGLKNYPTKSCVELATESRFAVNNPDAILTIDCPGDYGVSDFDIHGIAARRHLDMENETKASTIYKVEVGDVRIGVVGNIYEKLTDDQLEDLGVVDILIIPVGGNDYTLDATGAVSLTKAIDPKIVIPIHYSDKAISYEVPQSELSAFVTELGAPVETVAKYKVKGQVAQGALSVVEINRS